MGATPTQVIWHVMLPTALPGILTGVMLAVARAAGETAPLLFTALFSNFWPDALMDRDRVAGRIDLQLFRFAVREPNRNGLGRRAGAGAVGVDHQPHRPELFAAAAVSQQ